jgi:hypothetical protein
VVLVLREWMGGGKEVRAAASQADLEVQRAVVDMSWEIRARVS